MLRQTLSKSSTVIRAYTQVRGAVGSCLPAASLAATVRRTATASNLHGARVLHSQSALHQAAAAAAAAGAGQKTSSSSPAPTLTPELEALFHTANPKKGQYEKLFRLSLDRPDEFWLAAAKQIHWRSKGTRALTPAPAGARPDAYSWFKSDPVGTPNGERWELNACENMLDVHVANGRGDHAALIYDSAVGGNSRTITYKQMLEQVSNLAGAIKNAGVKKGDRVLIYMPACPETVQAMLATIRLGAIHSVVFGGFAANELAKRIADAKPTLILTASCGLESRTKIISYKPALDEAIKLSGHTPSKVLVWQRPQLRAELVPGRDEDWVEYVGKHGAPTAPVPVLATDPLYILYTSGTTGMPKGVVRDTGSITALKITMPMVYNHHKDDVFWSASDLGWAVGHSYIAYAPLLQGATTVLYEGKPVGTPDAGAFWRVISEHKVTVLFTAPTALRAIKKEDSEGKLLPQYDMSHFKALYLAGERADPASLAWARDLLKVPVIDHFWQTESGWPIVGALRGVESFPIRDGSASFPVPGWDVRALDDHGLEAAPGTQANLVVKLPLPPGGVQELWGTRKRFELSYMDKFPGWYDTADAGIIDKDGYVFVMARTDDVLNVAGHRLSSGQIEEVLSDHPSVAESAVVAVPDDLRGHVPVGLVVLKSGQTVPEEQIQKEIVAAVRKRVGAVANLHLVIVVARLPKTRSGKVLRNVMRAMAEGKTHIPVPPTIEDATVLNEIHNKLHSKGIGNKPDPLFPAEADL